MRPILQALVLADRIYEDRTTGKKIIAGTFNQINIQSVQVQPSPEPSKTMIAGGTDPGCPAVYISLTDVVNGTTIGLHYINVAKNEVVFKTAFRIEVDDRLATVEIVRALPPMKLLAKEAGTFSLDVVWEGEILGSHRILVNRPAQGDKK